MVCRDVMWCAAAVVVCCAALCALRCAALRCAGLGWAARAVLGCAGCAVLWLWAGRNLSYSVCYP